MNRPLRFRARQWTALAALLTASTAFAHGGAPTSVEPAKRATVPASACVVSSDAASNDHAAVPGPYAKYLMHQGMSKERALAAARWVDAGQAAASEAIDRRAAASSQVGAAVTATQ